MRIEFLGFAPAVSGRDWRYWDVDGEVSRDRVGDIFDIHGAPMGRWVASRTGFSSNVGHFADGLRPGTDEERQALESERQSFVCVPRVRC